MRGKNDFLRKNRKNFTGKKIAAKKGWEKNSGTERDARDINREARKEDVTSRQRARRRINNIGRGAVKKKENNKWASNAREREREREDVGLFLRRVSLYILREKRQKRMLGPIPAARARKTR